MGSTTTVVVVVVVALVTAFRLVEDPPGLASTSCTYRSGLVGNKILFCRDLRGEKKCRGIGLMGTISPSSLGTLSHLRDWCGWLLGAAALRHGWDTEDAAGGRKVEKLTVLLFHIQSEEDTEEARTMGKQDNDVDDVGAGADGDGADLLPDESGGSGLGATDGTSSEVKRQALGNFADNDDDGGDGGGAGDVNEDEAAAG